MWIGCISIKLSQVKQGKHDETMQIMETWLFCLSPKPPQVSIKACLIIVFFIIIEFSFKFIHLHDSFRMWYFKMGIGTGCDGIPAVLGKLLPKESLIINY